MQFVMPRPQALRIDSPNQLDGLALWLDAIDQNSLLASDGSVIEDGEAVALWSDKSGNSAENALLLNGVAGNSATSLNSAPLRITGDIQIDAEIAFSSYTLTTRQTIVAKYNSTADDRGYWFYVQGSATGTAGALVFQWSTDGTAATVRTAESTVALPVSAYEKIHVRATLDVDNGAGGYTVRFFWSVDGAAWSQLGSDVTVASTTSIFASTWTLEIGTLQLTQLSVGAIYRVQIYNGIGGPLVFDADFTAQSKLATSFTEDSSNAATVTINTSGATGARISGARDLYQGTVANRPVFLKYNGEKYGYLNGVSGNYFSTPDSAALSPTNEFEVIAHVQRSPGDNYYLIAQDDGGANRAYYVQINSAGNIVVRTVDAIGGVIFATSTEALPSGYSFIRVTVEQDNGSNSAVNYYTGDSISGPWTPLGSEVTGTQRQNIVSKSNDIWIGRQSSNYSSGLIKYLSFSTTIGGSPTAVFDASRYTTGSTFTASTGETWTLNGGAHIVQRTGLYFDGSNDYLKSASFSLSQPETAYVIGSQVSWTSDDYIFDGNAAVGMGLRQTGVSPKLQMVSGATPAISSDFVIKQTMLVCAVYSGANSSLRRNRNSALPCSPGINPANGFTLASRGDATRLGNVFISETAVYSTAHDTATQDRLALYAGRKWKFAV